MKLVPTKWLSEKIKWQDIMLEKTVEPPISVLNPLATEFKINYKATLVKRLPVISILIIVVTNPVLKEN